MAVWVFAALARSSRDAVNKGVKPVHIAQPGKKTGYTSVAHLLGLKGWQDCCRTPRAFKAHPWWVWGWGRYPAVPSPAKAIVQSWQTRLEQGLFLKIQEHRAAERGCGWERISGHAGRG